MIEGHYQRDVYSHYSVKMMLVLKLALMMVFALEIAGAMAENGCSLSEIKQAVEATLTVLGKYIMQ